MDRAPGIEPMAWLLGVLGTLTTGWVALTSKKVGEHEIKITVLEVNYMHIKNSLERIEKALAKEE